jgi:hypothetical protein
MFIEVYVVDGFTKAPLTDEPFPFPQNPRYPFTQQSSVYASIAILDPSD